MIKLLQKGNSIREITYFKYFISYLLLFTVLILGFFIIVKSQIIKEYYNQQIEQTRMQTESYAEQLNNEFVFLSQIDNSLISNISRFSYIDKTSNRYNIHRELTQYTSSAKLISFIVYAQKNSHNVIATGSDAKYINDTLYIGLQPGKEIPFDPAPYFDATSGQMIYLENNDAELLLYFPSINSMKKYYFFYSLDIHELKQQMNNFSSAAMPAMALIQENKEVAIGTNVELLKPYLKDIELKNGVYPVDASSSICVQTGVGNGFSVISLVSTHFLNQQINEAFRTVYLTLLFLAITGFLVILLAMRITYLPLHRLTKKIIPAPDPKQGYLEQIDSAFSTQATQNRLMLDKLNNYRSVIQKELLYSLIESKEAASNPFLVDVDQFFDATSRKKIYAVQIASDTAPLSVAAIHDYFQNALLGNNPCYIMTSEANHAVFLINYIGAAENKDLVLKKLLDKLHEETGYLCAMSNGSDSPLDIPLLYKNVLYASQSWNLSPVVDFQALPQVSDNLAYPYDEINLLSETLRASDFSSSRKCLDELLETINSTQKTESNVTNFFIQSILVDILMSIISFMGLSDIKFESFNDLFFETLYFCRSFAYSEKSQEISTNLYKLIDFCESELSLMRVSSDRIIQIMNEYYTQPDFSITMLADKFQISSTRMSHLFKEAMQETFSDYLWNLRLNKAKELLKNSDMPVNEVSISVGYYNDTSFHRKFKLSTHMTPSQYRTAQNKD